MSSFIKGMIIAVLVLSLIYLGSSAVLFSKREHWREQYMSLEQTSKQVESQLRGQVATLTQSNDTLSKELGSLTDQFGVQTQKLDKLRDEYASLTAASTELQSRYAAIAAAYENLDSRYGVAYELNKRLQDELAETDSKLTKSESQRSILQVENTKLAAVRAALEAETAELKKNLTATTEARNNLQAQLNILRSMGVAVDQMVGLAETPEIRGKVLRVDDKLDLVFINVGEKHGVKQGYEFTVWRDAEYVAKIRVELVEADISTGRPVEGFRRASIRVGDNVDTRLF